MLEAVLISSDLNYLHASSIEKANGVLVFCLEFSYVKDSLSKRYHKGMSYFIKENVYNVNKPIHSSTDQMLFIIHE